MPQAGYTCTVILSMRQAYLLVSIGRDVKSMAKSLEHFYLTFSARSFYVSATKVRYFKTAIANVLFLCQDSSLNPRYIANSATEKNMIIDIS